jgi:hypothetical protein
MCGHEADEPCVLGYDSRSSNVEPTPLPVAELPHSCGEWVIGGADEVRIMIEDLLSLLAELRVGP